MKKLILGIVIGLMLAPTAVYAKNRIFDSTAEVTTGKQQWEDLRRYDDPDFKVKCWESNTYGGGGISCLPWSEVEER